MHDRSRYIISCLTIAMSLICQVLTGQPRIRMMEYDDFNHSIGRVTRIVRDGQGMMWFGTFDGLYRYDGYDFHNFKSYSGDGVEMHSNRISSLYTSSESGLWCLVDDDALFFDLRTYRFINVLSQLEAKNGTHYSVTRLRSLSCGDTWLFTDNGQMFVVDDRHPDNSARLMTSNDHFDNLFVVCDSKGRSWILTSRHTYLYDKGKLTTYDQTFTRAFDSGSDVWLLSSDGAIHRFDEKKQSPVLAQRFDAPVTHFDALDHGKLALHSEKGVTLLSTTEKKWLPTDIHFPVHKLVQDKYGRLWFLDAANRLHTSNAEGKNVECIQGVVLDGYDLLQDKFGTLWFFGHHGEAYYASHLAPTTLHRYDQAGEFQDVQNTINDGQGGYWFISNLQAHRLTFDMPSFRHLPLHDTSSGRSSAIDSEGRLLIGTREDETMAVFDREERPGGYLTPHGTISSSYTPFGAAIYHIHHGRKGTLWMGSKRNGIFRLTPNAGKNFQVDVFSKGDTPGSLNDNEVYDMVEDARGRLWIATHLGGLSYTADPYSGHPYFVHRDNGLKAWKQDYPTGINALQVTPDGFLLVGTVNGLYVANVNTTTPENIHFNCHLREASRKESLSSNMITDILQTSDGRIFISTESGGINEIASDNLGADRLDFRHYNSSTGFPTDMVLSMVEYNHALWVTTYDRLIEVKLDKTGQLSFNAYLLNEHPGFTQAIPTQLSEGKWVFGVKNGAVVIDLPELQKSSFIPPLVVTGVSIENHPVNYATEWCDTILLSPKERSLTLWFSALDYENTEHISYAYHMGEKGGHWIYLGQNHSIALPNLQPGTYHITIRSTNTDGVWCDNQRTITIIVKPTFWQTPWAILLMALLAAAIIGVSLYTYFYIRKIKRQQHETMEKYLALIETPDSEENETEMPVTDAEEENSQENDDNEPSGTDEQTQTLDEADDALLKKIVDFIEANLSNSEISIEDMASACALSRSSLHRKVKGLVGASPMEFLREARIRKAVQQLDHTRKPISQIAYECGFSDPKYFSKCFKAATGLTPSEFRNEHSA